MKLKMLLSTALLACALSLAGTPAPAQTYPSKPIKIIVPVTPGGAIDIIARLVGEKMRISLGVPVVIENKPGASNNLGADIAAKSAPDGYTILIVASSHATSKFVYKDLSYDPVKDFEPIVYTHVVPLLLAVNPGVPAKTVPELIAWIKANPGQASYGSSGPGGSLHMAAELFMSMSGTKMLHVPYKGSAAAHPDLIGGRTKMIFDTVSAIQGHVKSGAVRGLAVTTLTRSSVFPGLPTISEAALPGYDASTWGGMLAPAGTPKEIVAKLNTVINAALKDEDVRAKLIASGIEVQGGTPEQFDSFIKSEIEKWGKVMKDAGIEPE
ncbi:MAG: tripartite tricarboxylate transporter substrate binding protein [Rhodoplanes sp.]|uniref:tripartite tricarboxylate transporter substrate binding protein n=1 Tax=Rhodoplanes sp. TaxID=1968906 RepID=UPI0017BADA3E|nr:tripartite tricarboxylate transporter substrate binding protein [Rhodoplanes sp.]NVO15344.1 tripartite tricarboxylate transporter substrate binding protein [Rhodoplanes sp.]